jgi:hypothetical protein
MRRSISSSLVSLVLLAAAPCAVHCKKKPDGDCFNSTEAILRAQLAVPPQQDFWICPNTTINIGIPTNAQFTAFNGDFPLSAIMDNVTIQCGHDGSSSNNCVLNGGLYQFITTPNNPFVPNKKISTHNLKVQGITFTGTLTNVPSGNGVTLSGASIGLGAPGIKMEFRDCVFTKLKLDSIMYLQKDALSSPNDLPIQSASVTVKDSMFTDITYKRDLIHVSDQTLNLKGNEFKDITYERGFCNCTRTHAINVLDSNMKLEKNYFENIQYYSSVVFVGGNLTDLKYSKNNGTKLIIVDKGIRPSEDYCVGGLIIDKVMNGVFDQCLDLFQSSHGSHSSKGSSSSSSSSSSTSTTTTTTTTSSPPKGGTATISTKKTKGSVSRRNTRGR